MKNTLSSTQKSLLSVLTTAVLLTLSFPMTSWWLLAYVALIPWMLVCTAVPRKQAFFYSWFCGILFFAGTLYWFVHVTVLGAVLLIIYLGLYFALFGWMVSALCRKSLLFQLLFFPAVWVMLEYLRAHLFSGFGWVCLGHSQFPALHVIQIADFSGVWGVSYFCVLVNIFLCACLQYRKTRSTQSGGFLRRGAVVVLLVVLFVVGYGHQRLIQYGDKNKGGGTARVALVQANIAQEDKWKEITWPQSRARYLRLTQDAARALQERRQDAPASVPEMIVWPETAFPGFLWEDLDAFEDVIQLVRAVDIPLLFGSVVIEEDRYYNAAILLSRTGQVLEEYHKLHLVPFGEFLPFRKYMPILADLVPIADFTAGDAWSLFSLPSGTKMSPVFFSVLICFEDTLENIARGFVRHGAQFLVNVTNDAWFQDTKAPYLHVACAGLRTVEYRRVLVHAANTGVSCVIDVTGRMITSVQQQDRQTYVEGFVLADIRTFDDQTVYCRFGEIFVGGCLLSVLAGLLWHLFHARTSQKKIFRLF